MFEQFRNAVVNWIQQQRCSHKYRYSRSKPGTLICRDCRKRRKPDVQIYR